ncbi:MAG: hypothetical protein V4714_21390 [Bacteroidota bacterium]
MLDHSLSNGAARAVWYNTAENKIDSLLTFKNRHKLEPYLEKIDIQSLL